jgi:hypothetical protein
MNRDDWNLQTRLTPNQPLSPVKSQIEESATNDSQEKWPSANQVQAEELCRIML